MLNKNIIATNKEIKALFYKVIDNIGTDEVEVWGVPTYLDYPEDSRIYLYYTSNAGKIVFSLDHNSTIRIGVGTIDNLGAITLDEEDFNNAVNRIKEKYYTYINSILSKVLKNEES